MTKFEDGPAKGQVLMLGRAPLFLRVAEDAKGWDALDQLDDHPRSGETFHAYQRVALHGRIHLYFGGSKGGWFASSSYRHLEEQPTQEVMGDNEQWRNWCRAAKKRRGEQPAKKVRAA